jgi:hypothetical protein
MLPVVVAEPEPTEERAFVADDPIDADLLILFLKVRRSIDEDLEWTVRDAFGLFYVDPAQRTQLHSELFTIAQPILSGLDVKAGVRFFVDGLAGTGVELVFEMGESEVDLRVTLWTSSSTRG